MPHEIRVTFLFLQDAVHAFQNMRVDISCHVSEIGRNVSLYQGAVDLPLFVVHLFHHPDPSGDGNLVSNRRRLDDGTQLFRAGAHGIFDIFLKYCVKFIIVYNPFSRKAYDQASVFRPADVIDFKQMPEQNPVILLRDPVKAGQRQNP